MKKRKKKVFMGIILIAVAMACCAFVLMKFEKQFKLSNVQIKGAEYNVMDAISADDDKSAIETKINNAVNYFTTNEINTVFLRANSQKTAVSQLEGFDYLYIDSEALKKVDLIKKLKTALAKEKIQLYITIDATDIDNQTILSMAQQLYKEYAVAGISIDNYSGETEYLQQIKLALNKNYKKYSLFLQTDNIDIISQTATLGAVDGYIAENMTVEEYRQLKETVIPTESLLLHYSSPTVKSDAFVLTNFYSLDGAVLTQFTQDDIDISLLKTAMTQNSGLPTFNFSVKKDFNINYPEDGFSTYYTGVYMTGTGQAGGKISVNGTEYTAAKDGTFGIFLELEKGDNQFNVTQDGTTKTITVTRKVSTYTGSSTKKWDDTKEAQKGQLVETANDLTSIISDKNDDSSIISGLPKGTKLVVMESEKTSRSGKYTYAYKLSNGAYVLTKNVIWSDMTVEGYEKSKTYQQTSKDETDGKSNTTKENTDSTKVYSLPKITKIYAEALENGDEKITFEVNGMPAVISSLGESAFELQFLDASTSSFSMPQSSFYNESEITQQTDGVHITMPYNTQKPLWGYDVTVEEGKVTVYLKKSPVLSKTDKPLSGVTIMLDAGHGQTDTGAAGIAGGDGPVEKDLNLAVTLATKACLEEYGAAVLLTRSDDTFLSLEQRRSLVKQLKPDLFIAVHHNSLDYSVDSTNASGSECYYFSPQSEKLAQAMVNNVSSATGRKNRGSKYGYYYVTRTEIAPSVLMEYSFINNAGEYSKTYTDADIYKAAYGTLSAVLSVIPQ